MVLKWLKKKAEQKQRDNFDRTLSTLVAIAEEGDMKIQSTGQALPGTEAQRVTKVQDSMLWDLVGPVELECLRRDYLDPIIDDDELSNGTKMTVRHLFDTAAEGQK